MGRSRPRSSCTFRSHCSSSSTTTTNDQCYPRWLPYLVLVLHASNDQNNNNHGCFVRAAAAVHLNNHDGQEFRQPPLPSSPILSFHAKRITTTFTPSSAQHGNETGNRQELSSYHDQHYGQDDQQPWPGNLTLPAGIISRYLGDESSCRNEDEDENSENVMTAAAASSSIAENDLPTQKESASRLGFFNHPNVLDDDDSNSNSKDSSNIDEKEGIFSPSNKLLPPKIPKPIPLAYRFYRRAMYRQRSSWPIPFVLLGPNVDHWKASARALAAAGFSAIACERVEEDDDQNDNNIRDSEGTDDNNESRGSPFRGSPTMDGCDDVKNDDDEISSIESSAKAIVDLLDALRWNRAVLVACDSECAMAIQAALRLAPERIVGLVLCGRLDTAEAFVQTLEAQQTTDAVKRRMVSSSPNKGPFAVDRFLRRYMDCPSIVVWDGDGDVLSRIYQQQQDLGPSLLTEDYEDFDDDELAHERKVIHGSGSAPHRKVPEQLAWVISRFVEERVAPWPSSPTTQEQSQQPSRTLPEASKEDDGVTSNTNDDGTSIFDFDFVPNFIRHATDFFSQDGIVVFGRIVASALFYGTVIKVGLYQYRTIWNGIFDFQTKLQLVISAPAKAVAMIGSFVSSFSISSNTKPVPQEPSTGREEKQTESLAENKEEGESAVLESTDTVADGPERDGPAIDDMVETSDDETESQQRPADALILDEAHESDSNKPNEAENGLEEGDEAKSNQPSENGPDDASTNREGSATNSTDHGGAEKETPQDSDSFIRPFFFLDYVIA